MIFCECGKDFCSFVHPNRPHSSWITYTALAPRHSTIPSVLTVMRAGHICLDVLLHQLAAINTSPLSTCVRSSGIWAALSEVCCCIIRISAGTLEPFPAGALASSRGAPGASLSPAAICRVFLYHKERRGETYQSTSFNAPLLFLKGQPRHQSNTHSLT